MKTLLLKVILCIFLGSGVAMAQSEADKFLLLEDKDAPRHTFDLSAESLSFETVDLPDFVWDNVEAFPMEFSDYALFRSFQQEWVGYAPLNRDRFEVRVYSASIFEERVALGTSYSKVLATKWGALNFGIQSRGPNFGEILGGDNSSGVMFVNRIAVIRRGTELLIVRMTFEAEHFNTYKSHMAQFLGNLMFTDPQVEDPIVQSLSANKISVKADNMAYPMPEKWTNLHLTPPKQFDGEFDFWVDEADPNRNSGLIVASIWLEKPDRAADTKPDATAMADMSALIGGLAIENLLSTEDYELIPVVKNEFDDLDEITAFNSLFNFKFNLKGLADQGTMSVLITMGQDGRIIASGLLGPWQDGDYLQGTGAHGDFVQSLLLEAQKEFWTANH